MSHLEIDAMHPLSADYPPTDGVRPIRALSDAEEILRLRSVIQDQEADLERGRHAAMEADHRAGQELRRARDELSALKDRVTRVKRLAVGLSEFLEEEGNRSGSDAVELLSSALGGA